ncbi:MAG: MATE family efflux transporter [Myxococcales bacterium]|nr:MATE family efflux transporter [Myxococcales bacterium]MCB9523093.1 MATE family efflux transporter [Myxococcales bacterium]
MLTAERRARIQGLALPIIGGMISQNVLNLVDTGMVGALGDAALAGVGLGSFANFMAIAFITGASAGVQAMAARRRGEGRDTETAIPLNGGLLVVAAVAVPLSALLIWLAPSLFPLLDDDPEVVALGTTYLQVRLVAMVAVGANFAFRGYWNAIDRSKLYLRTLLVMHVTNIALNYLLIFGHFGFPELGVKGAALGTAISTYVGTAYYVWMGRTYARENGFLRGLPDGATVKTMLRLAVPAGLQQFFFAAGMTVFFRLVGMVGTQELAASNVLVNLLLVAILPGLGFGLAAATLVGQALGQGDREAAHAWGSDVVKLSVGVITIIALPAMIYPQLLLMPFIRNPETLALAAEPLRIIAILLPLDAVGMVLMNALLGAGDAKKVMAVSVSTQWAVQLPLVYLVGPHLGWGLIAIWAVQSGARALQSLVFLGTWRGSSWGHAKV